jgi:heme-degrading monooxygenase HmoA
VHCYTVQFDTELGAGVGPLGLPFCGRSSHAGAGEVRGVVEILNMQKIDKGQVARSVRFDLATDKNEEFHTIFRNDVLPILKKQDGFRNELLFTDDQHVLAISVWNNLDSARKYETSTYPQVDKSLRPLMFGAPTVETYNYDSLSTTA